MNPFYLMLLLSLLTTGCATTPKQPTVQISPIYSEVSAEPQTSPDSFQSPPAQAQGESSRSLLVEPPQYSVEMVMTSKDQNAIMKRFIDNGKTRTEIVAEGRQMVLIERPDTKAAYVIMPGEKMYFEKSISPVSNTPETIKPELVGTESINGQACDKYQVVSNGQTGYVWKNQQTHFPVRMQDDAHLIEWKNYKAGPQSAALFEIPAGYEGYEMPDMTKIMATIGGQMAMQQLGGMASGMAGQALGGALSAAGAAAGGPVGAMIGQMLGQQIAGMVVGKIQNMMMDSMMGSMMPKHKQK